MSRPLAPGLPRASEWHLEELRYSRPANCLVALLRHRERSGRGRVYVRSLTARRYRRLAETPPSLLEIAVAAEAPVLFVSGCRRSGPGPGWDWDRLVAVDLRSLEVRRLRGLEDRKVGRRTWVSRLLGCAADGRTVHMIFARERPVTPQEFSRLKARFRREGIVVQAGAERRHATHVDYLVSQYSVRTGRMRDIALLPDVFA